MKKNNNSILRSHLIEKRKSSTTLFSRAGHFVASINQWTQSATLKANHAAKQTGISVYIKEDNAIYEVNDSGEKNFIKSLEKLRKVPTRFKLK